MSMRMTHYTLGPVVAICLFVAMQAAAADTPPPAPGGGQGRGNWDPAQMQQRMLDRIKETLAPTDEEWKVLQPKVEAVQKLAMQARTGGGGMFGRRRQQGAEDPTQPAREKSDVEKKTAELQALIDNKDTAPKAIQTKMQELRDAKTLAKLNLKKAQDDLRELLTPKQEAQMLMMGMME